MSDNFVTPSHIQKLQSDLLANAIRSVTCDMDNWREDEAQGRTSFSIVHVGDIDVFRLQSKGKQRSNRKLEHVRNDRNDNFFICLPESGEFHFRQHGTKHKVLPGQFSVVTSLRPFDISGHPLPHKHAFLSFYVRIPAPLLRQRYPTVDDVCNMPISLASGQGKMLQSVITALIQHGPQLSKQEAVKTGELLLELISGTIQQEARMPDTVRPRHEMAKSNILDVATNFIVTNLSDPELDTSLVARHCRISVRYLQKIFESTPMNVAQTIRETRLQRCREFLRAPGLRDRTIAEIASSWGFGQPTHFSRAYKTRFGLSPREERWKQEIASLP